MKVRILINLLLVIVIAGLIYVLINSIREPIAFQREKARREQAVVDKLIKIRQAQELYRGVTGFFAPNFDTLQEVLETRDFTIVRVEGDPDDPTNPQAVTYDTVYKPAIDSVRTLGLKLDSLRYVPFTGGKIFNIDADTLTYQQTLVSVVEVGVPRKEFMGRFADPRYAKYDQSYDPNKPIKFGNMNAPNTSGNWEQ